MKPLTRKELDAALTRGCDDPSCVYHHEPLSEIFLKAKCHPGGGLSVSYQKGGLVVVTCRVCTRLVRTILVAP